MVLVLSIGTTIRMQVEGPRLALAGKKTREWFHLTVNDIIVVV